MKSHNAKEKKKKKTEKVQKESSYEFWVQLYTHGDRTKMDLLTIDSNKRRC